LGRRVDRVQGAPGADETVNQDSGPAASGGTEPGPAHRSGPSADGPAKALALAAPQARSTIAR
jgi:hypothetical protein